MITVWREVTDYNPPMTAPPTDFSPEQKRRRLIILAVVVAAYVLSFFQRFAPAGIAQDLAAAFQTSAASLGVLAATYFYVYTIMQVPTGILVDTLGPRRILLLGGMVAGGGSLLFGMADSLDAALVGRTLIGLGVSVTFIAMLKLIAVWFEERRFATVVGVSMLIGNLGSVLAGAPLSALAQATGWRGVFVGVGIVSLALGILAWILVRDRPSARGGAVLPAPTFGSGRADALNRLAPVSLHRKPDEAPAFDRTVILTGLLRVVKNRATWPTVFVNMGLSGSFFAFGGLWATPFLIQGLGMSRATATAHLSLYFAGFAVGCLLVGMLSDRLRRRKPVILVSSHIYGVIWLVWLSGMALPLVATYTLFGLMGLMTASFTLSWACAKEVNPPALSGMSTSVTNMGGFLMGALLQPAVGWIMDQRWTGLVANGVRIYAPEDYRWGLLLIACAAWGGAAAAWKVKETHCRNIWKELDKEKV
jgi:sugar phosphate permease